MHGGNPNPGAGPPGSDSAGSRQDVAFRSECRRCAFEPIGWPFISETRAGLTIGTAGGTLFWW